MLLRHPLATTLLAAAFISGCSPLNMLDVLVPAGEYELTADLPYGDLPRQRLDIYRPATLASSGPGPVIVFFYGGSWKTGERHQYRFVGEALTRRGFTVVIPDYRLFPEVTFPAFMTDAARALRWVRDNLRGEDGDTRPLFLAGHSAGAHIAALLTVDAGYLDGVDLSPDTVCGVIGLAGPYVFDPSEYKSTRPVFGGLDDMDTARPVRLITGRTPPFLLLHGKADRTVYPWNTTGFATALQAAGTDVRTRLLTGIGHSRILLSISQPFDDIAPVNDLIAEFVRARVRARAECKQGFAPRRG